MLNEVVVDSVKEVVSVYCESDQIDGNERCDQSVQCDFDKYTNYDHFMIFFLILCPAPHDLNFKCHLLSPQDQLFLVLMKLSQAKGDIELSYMFEVSESTVSNIIVALIIFMNFKLKELDVWPSRSLIDEYMPNDLLLILSKQG